MQQVFFHNDQWLDENPKLIGPMNHTFWMASAVFDGARVFDGKAPDLDQHCERLINSARSMLLKPTKTAQEVMDLCLEAARKFPDGAELYVRPMFYAAEGFVAPDPDSTDFVLAVYDSPMPGFAGFSSCWSPFRRPAADMAPTNAKASCLYPNSARAIRDAESRGFDNAIVLDANNNVAEFATANIWIAKDGVALTPVPNGTFLNGVTRRRVIKLLRDDGIEVREASLTREDVMEADEVFNTGNYGKVMPVTKLEDRDLQPGPIANRARDLYWDYANGFSI